jgi:hypothetical protein
VGALGALVGTIRTPNCFWDWPSLPSAEAVRRYWINPQAGNTSGPAGQVIDSDYNKYVHVKPQLFYPACRDFRTCVLLKARSNFFMAALASGSEVFT